MARLVAPPILLLLVATLAPAATWLGQVVPVAPDVYVGHLETTAADPAAADALFAEARAAAEAGASSEVFDLAARTLHADPGHAAARTVLGYELVDGVWRTPYEASNRLKNASWRPRYGWLTDDENARYEAGERLLGRRWITAEQDASRREAIEDGWTIRTDHFAVTTNHSLEAGAQLAAELEGLFQVWRQAFAGYWLEDREVRALFAGERMARKRSRPMKVYYHRDKAGYVEHLRRRQPRIAETLGIYFDDAREAHFFAPPEGADAEELELARATLYHEAAHQLFAENGPGRRGAGRDANFWLVEGAACYFELLAPGTDLPGPGGGPATYTLGNPAQGRLPSALARGPVLPLAELAVMGQTDLQRRDDLAAVYAQATGLVAMLRHGQHAAEDREALVRTLRAVYSGRPDGEEIARQTGRSAAELDEDYRQFLGELVPGSPNLSE
jgi:hypothetical protein